MRFTRFVVSTFSVGMIVLGTGTMLGQTYPNKPIRIVTAAVGGGSDFGARLIAPGLSVGLGQQVIVENRANSIIAAEVVSKAPPDGYSLFFAGNNFWIGPLLQKMPYDPVKDFSPITLVARAPNLLVVHPSLPVKSVKELIALAKARPGELNYATGPTGVPNHIAGELLKSMAHINMVRVSYKGAGPAVSSVLGGETQLMFPNAPAVMPHVKAGRLRALAVTSAQPTVLAPGLPTVAASGLPGYESVSEDALFVPAKTPLAIISSLNQEIVRVLNMADVKEKYLNVGVETIGSSPEELAAAVKLDLMRTGKVIKDAGIRVD